MGESVVSEALLEIYNFPKFHRDNLTWDDIFYSMDDVYGGVIPFVVQNIISISLLTAVYVTFVAMWLSPMRQLNMREKVG